MKLSELSAQTGVSTATLKFYLRESLLSPGEPITRTQSDYGTAHLERVRLIRALVESGGLKLNQVRNIIEALDSPEVPRHQLFGVAQAAITGPTPKDASTEWTHIARGFVHSLGWQVGVDEPLLVQLGVQLKALADSFPDHETGISTLKKWAAATELIARADVDMLPGNNSEALKGVVVGTVLSDRLLQTLRRLAQRHSSAQCFETNNDNQH